MAPESTPPAIASSAPILRPLAGLGSFASQGRKLARRLLARGRDLLYPPLCALCRLDLPPGPLQPEGFCPECWGRLVPTIELRLPSDQLPGQDILSLLSYDDLAREAIRRWKYQGDLVVGGALAEALASVVPDWAQGDLVVPVPGHPYRRRQRGFEPAAMLARSLASTHGRYSPLLLDRSHASQPQSTLARAERLQNAATAFRLSRPGGLTGLSILLVDDVRTTGASLYACRTLLLERGARRVVCIALAQTPDGGEGHPQ